MSNWKCKYCGEVSDTDTISDADGICRFHPAGVGNHHFAEVKMDKLGSFKIQSMTFPVGRWIWSFFDAEGKHTSFSHGGYHSAEDAARDICRFLKSVGADKEVKVWIERKVRTKWKCQT